MKNIGLFILSVLFSLGVLAQDTGIYKISILKKNWYINGYDLRYQAFQPEVLNPSMNSEQLMNILYDAKSSGTNIPEVLQNIEKNNIDTEYNYEPLQARNAVMLSATFKRNTNTFLLRNQEFRIGIQFNSNTIPAVVIREKVYGRYHQFHPINKDLSLDLSYLINTRPLGNWAIYMGVGGNIGVSIQNKYICYVRNSNGSMNGLTTNAQIKDKASNGGYQQYILYGKPSFVTTSYGLVGFKYNLDCEFNLFSELSIGHTYRKYVGVNVIESIYLGATVGFRYKINKDKLIYKKKSNPFW